MDADVPGTVNWTPRFALFSGKSHQRKGKSLFCLRDEPSHAPFVDQVLQPRLLPIGAVAILIEDTNHGGGDRYSLFRAQQQAAIGGKLLVSRNAAKQNAKIDACRNIAALANMRRNETYIVGVRNHADGAAAVESDVELARQSIHVARIQDVVVERFGQRGYIVEFGGVDAGDGRGSDVTDVVGA